ncbi:zinc-binding dehydrogenase [Frankia sp. CNm7]|uniref:Zinc-binding dehydrogenase n=1 Tax=Frankia nepalensis TaxID=1836974 RepID=A0A937UN26_9ACTN|nr:zinc-binding dehydrogenase [Frankia nepalensis]MBL7500308.1 zinc-binding dehydrogenase [Frankia nepalensis]MBL7508530.1 zinc-binding dehydrogenase [Frankia nepalensis]MBL7520429.1 zinc-binding dehydrogenase [Frankia nepalensis]MBL7627658.1 zinc-binding dehydrogenase [Frankia nepalensis]
MTLALVSKPGTSAPTLEEVPPPPLGPGDLRVRVTAASVDLIDVLIAAGPVRTIFGLTGTVGVGCSLTGVVTETGPDVTGFSVGDPVAAIHRDFAAAARGHAEETVVPAAAAAPLPNGLDPVDAASVPLNALTAAQLLDRLGPAEERTLLVTGAAGSVGGYAVALAAHAGWAVTGLARESDRDFVLRAGARDLVTELPGPSFDAVLDGAVLHTAALAALRDGGAFVGVPQPSPPTPERDIKIDIVSVEPDGARLAALLTLAATGVLELRVAGRVPLAEAATAYDKVAGGGQRGRWLLVP